MYNQIYYALILSLVILSVNTQEFNLFHEELTSRDFAESDIVGWTNNKGITSYLTTCEGQSVLGGFGKFSQRTELKKTFSELPAHTEIKIEFLAYKIDSWDAERLTVSDGTTVLKTLTKLADNSGTLLCGAGWRDEKEVVEIIIEHTGDSFELVFLDNLNQGPRDESWGIRDLKISLKGCPEGEQAIGSECFSREELIHCSDSVKPLFENIKGDCTLEEKDEEFFYKFNVDYIAPYTHNADCFTQEIYVEKTKLSQGEAEFDQWTFDEVSQQIVFSIKQDDLEDIYGCTRVDTVQEFTWSCDFQLHLLLGGEVIQHKFNFEMKVILGKAQRDVLNLKVIQDESSYDCCENELNIDTELKFCKTFECLEYHELPYTVKRSEEIFLEHSITSPDFLQYYLHPSEVVIFGVVADILEVDGSNTGKLIYKVKSQLAFDDMLVEVISILDDEEYAPSRRRQLQGTIREDYDIKDISQISVVSDPKSNLETENTADNKSVDQKETNADSEDIKTLTIGLISASALIGLLVITGFSFVCYRRYSKNSRKAQYGESIPRQTQNTEVLAIN